MTNVESWWTATRRFVGRGQHARGTPRIGLAFGGGFARGIAHAGVLRVLERHNIPIHCVSGISAGAMVAAAFAGGCSSEHIEKIGSSMRFRDVARWTISRFGFAGSDRMVTFLQRLLKENHFEEMKIPLAIVATDLGTGQPVVFKGSGDVVLPIRASCSYPGLFLPIRYQGRCLVDGAISMEVPTKPLREMGATHIIAVHLPSPQSCPDPTSMFSVVNRCFQAMSSRLEQEWRRYADLVISPEAGDLPWDSFESARRMVELGEQAATAALPVLQRWLAQPQIPEKQQGLRVAV